MESTRTLTKTGGITETGLKWIALITMVLDHIHYFFGFTGWIPEWFSMAGRLAAGAVSTRHFAGFLRRDAALLTSATGTIARQRLDTPLTGKAKVREFGETLAAMEQMRLSLAQSLERQWAMEQQRPAGVCVRPLRKDLPAEMGKLRELLQERLPAPADLSALRRIGIPQPVVVAGEIQDIHPDALQTLPAEVLRRRNPPAGVHIERLQADGEPDVAHLV